MVDQKIGPRQLSQKVSAVITKCGRFWYYKLRQLLLQIAAANLSQNGNLYYKKGTGISIPGFITQRGILVFLTTLKIYFKKFIMRKLDYEK